MNDQMLYCAIARKPKLSAVRAADLLNIEVEVAHKRLGALVDVGDIERHDITLANNQPGVGFDFTEAFRKTTLYKSVLQLVWPTPDASTPTADRIKRVVAFVRERGRASNAELHHIAGLAPDRYVSTFLSAEVTRGVLAREGRDWVLGSKAEEVATPAETTAPAAAPVPEPVAPPAPAPKADPQPIPTLTAEPAVEPKLYPPPRPRVSKTADPLPLVLSQPATPAPAAPLRCGVWSDGILEIHRGGIVLKLDKAEAKLVIAAARLMHGLEAA